MRKLRGGALMALCLFLILLQVRDTQAWSVRTHEVLSRRAAEASLLNSGGLTNLDFQGLNTKISGFDFDGRRRTQEIQAWIGSGANFEDDAFPQLRFLRHFHNPLFQQPWDRAGLGQQNQSALRWAQDVQTNPNWSWPVVRQSYYQALTLLQKPDREAQFVRVFAGLGHVIHLVQDMSQPSHVLNDAHPEASVWTTVPAYSLET